MNTKLYYFSILLILGVMVSGCKKETIVPQGIKNMDDLVVSPGFDFSTSRNIVFTISALDNQDNPMKNIRIDVYRDYSENEVIVTGERLFSGFTNESGKLEMNQEIPAYLTEVVLCPKYIGLPNAVTVKVVNNKVAYTLGGSNAGKLKSTEEIKGTATPGLTFMGTFNSQGVPNYLATNDIVTAGFLADINATFPEYKSVPTYHPQYLAAGNEGNLKITAPAEVWVTFVHEGANYRNVLCYYTYPEGNPPAGIIDIQTLNVVFPNVSFLGSGGGLASGNKVKLGNFPAGVEIGFAIIADGWNGSNVITVNKNVYYTDKNLNPETNTSLKQHTVLLNDMGRQLLLIGIEDLRRDGSCDNDFNDAMFYATSNPIVAIETTNLPVITYTSVDSDGDGVSNNFDDYPNDPTRAINNYYPSQNTFATLAFEDLWPGKGDYDFNDIVIDYRLNPVLNGQNKVVSIGASFKLKAVGASFKNGFGIELPVAPSSIASVTGSHITENLLVFNSNGTEAGQSKAVIIAFDNAYKVLTYAGSGFGINTTPGMPYVTPVTIDMNINFTSPVLQSVLGAAPYNPFIFVNQVRGREIHLVDKSPTSLADLSFFGTVSDDSNPAANRYYRTANNLPWAINIIDTYDYPTEQTPIIQAHLKFGEWAESSGFDYFDWFQDKPGYREASKLYLIQ